MEEQVPENPPSVLHSIFFSGALSIFGIAVALTELGSEWTTANGIVGIATAIVFSAVVVASLMVFKTTKLRVVAVLVTVITLLPLAAWSQKSFRRQLFDSFAGILPVAALQNAVKNDFLKVEGICQKISGLNNGAEKLLAISESTPEISRLCSGEIAKTPAGKLALLAKIENDAAFCDFIGRLESLDSIFMRLLARGTRSVNSQKCLSVEIDKNYDTDEIFIKMLDDQKTPDLVGMVAAARYSKTSERLSSDALGVWLFQEGCMSQDSEILAQVGVTDTCSTMTVESGWHDICDRVGAEITMGKICRLARTFTLGASINEGKRIVHRAIRKYRIQIEAQNIARYDNTSYSAISGFNTGGRGGGGGSIDRRKLENSGLLALANGRTTLGSRNAALMPVGVNQLVANLEGFEMPTHSQKEWSEMGENVFRQLLTGKFDDSRIAGFLEANGMDGLLPEGQSMKELFEANGESLSKEQEKTLEAGYAKFKKNYDKSGKNKLTKNAPKKPKERVKKKRDRAIKAQPTLGN